MLAVELGCAPSAIMEWPSSDLTLLSAYYRLQPFGTARDDLHHARTQALMANIANDMFFVRGNTKSRRKHSPAEFMFQRRKSEQQKLRALTVGLRGLMKK